MQKTVFEISKMDCPSEENLIRLQLEEVRGIRHLDFNIPRRRLVVYHSGETGPLENALSALNLGSSILSSTESEPPIIEEQTNQRQLLWTVLFINLGFFVLEMTTGLISKSMGLVADSLDMLADAFVYGISLMAVGGTLIKKKRVAKIAGYFQILLALIGFGEVLRRYFLGGDIPDFLTMILVSVMALIGNSICLYLLQKSKSKDEAHIKASMIFTSNDVIINTGVIVAGILVFWLGSNLPDLIIGSVVFVLVIIGAMRILKLGNMPATHR